MVTIPKKFAKEWSLKKNEEIKVWVHRKYRWIVYDTYNRRKA